MPRSVDSLRLEESDEKQLKQWASAFGTPQQVALRCRVVLSAAEGVSVDEMAARLETNRKTVMLWRKRFAKDGLEALWEVAAGRLRRTGRVADPVGLVAVAPGHLAVATTHGDPDGSDTAYGTTVKPWVARPDRQCPRE